MKVLIVFCLSNFLLIASVAAQDLIPPPVDNSQVPFITHIRPTAHATNQNDTVTTDFANVLSKSHRITQAQTGELYVVNYNKDIIKVAPDGGVSVLTGVTNAKCVLAGRDGFVYVGTDDGKVFKVASDGSSTLFINTGGSIHDIIEGSNGKFYAMIQRADFYLEEIEANGSNISVYSIDPFSYSVQVSQALDDSFYIVQGLYRLIIHLSADGTSSSTFMSIPGYTRDFIVGRDGYYYLADFFGNKSSIYKVDPASATIVSKMGEVGSTVGMLQTSDGDLYVTDDSSFELKRISKTYALTIEEFLANATVVATVETYEPNSDPLTYRISAGNSSGAFAINSSGEIVVQDESQLDLTKHSSFTLTVVANDGTHDSQEEELVIHLQAINLNPPVVSAGQIFEVVEDAAVGTVVDTVEASDADRVTVLQNWSITSGNTNNTFAINSSTGQISVQDNSLLEPTQPSFQLGISVSDGQHTSAVETVTIHVAAVNHPPSFTGGGDVLLLEDSGPQSMGWASNISTGRPLESGQQLHFSLTHNQPDLFTASPTITAAGTLNFTPAPDAFGTAIVEVVLKDDGGTAHGGDDSSDTLSFRLQIEAVNDAPSFTLDANEITVAHGAAAYTRAEWATDISAGAANELGQQLSFTLTHDHPELFTEVPQLDATGTLTFTVADQVAGSAVVMAVLQDDGGTERGGLDQSQAVQFKITIARILQVIHFTPIDDQQLDVASVQLEASGGDSANPVTFSLETEPAHGVAHLEGNMLILEGAGEVLLRANQAGNAQYAPATEVVLTFSITRIPQHIEMTPIADQRAGAAPVILEASGGGSANPVSFTLETDPTSGVAYLEGNSIVIEGAGEVTVYANQAGNDRYAPAEEIVLTFTVSPGELFLPSLFSPNADGTNDRFQLMGATANHIASVAMIIYNQQGQIVYHADQLTSLMQEGWDGTHGGVEQPPGNYVWVLKGSDTEGRPLHMQGSTSGRIRLIR